MTCCQPGVLFNGQLIAGQMFGLQASGLFKVLVPCVDTLTGQAIHQIQIDIVEACMACSPEGVFGIASIMDAFQPLQFTIIEALNANGQGGSHRLSDSRSSAMCRPLRDWLPC